MKLVRYVGVTDPMLTDRENVQKLLDAGTITIADVWAFNKRRLGAPLPGGGFGAVTACIPGVTRRILSQRLGFSKKIVFGPKAKDMVQEVTEADWEQIRRLPEAEHFMLEEEYQAEMDRQLAEWQAARVAEKPTGTVTRIRDDRSEEPVTPANAEEE